MAHDTTNELIKEVIFCKIAEEKAAELVEIIESYVGKDGIIYAVKEKEAK